MKKLLLIVLIFLLVGAVSAHDDYNSTDMLKDTQYSGEVDDEDGMLVVEKDDYIPVDVNVDEPWSLNVYMDGLNSTVNDDFVNVEYDQINIPTSVMKGDDEVSLDLGKHRIVYEFKFTNTTTLYRPEAYVSDSIVYFEFEFLRNVKNPQNSIYRFTSQFNIVQPTEPISTTLYPDEIDITYSDMLSFELKGLTSGKATFYLDDEFFKSFEIDDNPFEEEIDTSKLAIGSYNLVCIVETDKLNGEYNIEADTSTSTLSVNFARVKLVSTPMRYIAVINTTLNVCDFPDLNPIYMDVPQLNLTYTRSIPLLFEGEGDGNLVVYIDGKKVYDNPIMLSWDNVCYIPTRDADGRYFDEGIYDISYEFVFSDKYVRFYPTASWYGNALVFNFLSSQDSGVFLNDKYIAKGKLKITDSGAQFVPIDSDAIVNIVHTNDINIRVDGIINAYNLTVFVNDVEIYDSYTTDNTIAVKTFYARESLFETNERDIQIGSHRIKFEFRTQYYFDVNAEFKNNVMHFTFKQTSSDANPDGVYYQLNTSLIVTEKAKTVHIMNVKNYTYFDDTEFIVKMDTYVPEEDDDWDDDDDEIPIGTQDVGIIVSQAGRIIYTGDYLMNVYERLIWNFDFENELLPKAGVYTMKIINLADNTYDTKSFEVKKANRVFNRKYTSDDFNVLFTLDFSPCKEDLNGPCHIVLDGQEKTINVKKGVSKSKQQVLFKDIDPGTYTATFTLKGNDIYNDVTLKSKVTVKKEDPTISYHQSGSNSLELTIDVGQSKTDAVMIVSAGGVEKKFTVNKNTKHLSVEFNSLPSGYYNVKIDFKGNERYTAKTLNAPLEITYSNTPDTQPTEKTDNSGKGLGNNTGGIGTGSGDGNVTGSGNGTYNGKISLNGKGFNGDLGSQGSGHGDGAKSYEIAKKIKDLEEFDFLWIFLIIALVILFISFIYERRDDDDSEEY